MKKHLRTLATILIIVLLFSSCANESTEKNADIEASSTTEETQATDNDLAQYEKVRAAYIDFSFGDLPHYIFKPIDGSAEIDFNQNKDSETVLEADDDNADQGIGINPAMKGKTFDVYFQNEKVTPAGWDEADAVDGKIIYKLVKSQE